jgi:hypothetical protein
MAGNTTMPSVFVPLLFHIGLHVQANLGRRRMAEPNGRLAQSVRALL